MTYPPSKTPGTHRQFLTERTVIFQNPTGKKIDCQN